MAEASILTDMVTLKTLSMGFNDTVTGGGAAQPKSSGILSQVDGQYFESKRAKPATNALDISN